MQTINQAYVMGLIEFKSNQIDQSPEFLRTILAALQNNPHKRFSILNTPTWELDYDTEYHFEDFVEDQLETVITHKDSFDELFSSLPGLKKVHPKSQFNKLKLFITYREINEYSQFVQSGRMAVELNYDSESDRILTVINDTAKTVHNYNAATIKNKLSMDAIDTFTEAGITALLWHMQDYMRGWKYNAEDFPVLNAIVNNHDPMTDNVPLYLNAFKEAGLDNIVRTDVQAYIENELEDHLLASSSVQTLLELPTK